MILPALHPGKGRDIWGWRVQLNLKIWAFFIVKLILQMIISRDVSYYSQISCSGLKMLPLAHVIQVCGWVPGDAFV